MPTPLPLPLRLQVVLTPRDWAKFVALPWDSGIYANDPNWVPPLRLQIKDLLDPKKNPFFKHAKVYAVIAWRGKCPVGRLLGVIDENHNTFHDEKIAFFGFFESEKNPETAQALFAEISKWAQLRGMRELRGPMNPSTNHECGLLVDGFEDPPSVMMTYNPPYYGALIEGCGLKKSKDLYAWELKQSTTFSDRLLKHAERLKRRTQIHIRPVNLKNFDAEVDQILEIYNNAWEKNWGFVPMTPEEFRHMAKDLKSVLDPRLLLIAEVRGEAVGFALALPDINQALKSNRSGKLLPLGLVKLLWNLKGPGRKKRLNRLRILTLGIKRGHQSSGLGPLLYTEYLKLGRELGYERGEASWILEDNLPMNRALEQMQASHTKTYRIYEKGIKTN